MDAGRRMPAPRGRTCTTSRDDPLTGGFLQASVRVARPGHDFADNVLYADTDGVCPRCLGWIAADDIVRRTAYGPLEHEACPVTPGRTGDAVPGRSPRARHPG